MLAHTGTSIATLKTIAVTWSQSGTTLKLLQIMTDKGLVRRDDSARSHVYEASAPAETTQRQLVGDLLDKAFGGSARNLVMQALADKRASPEELAEIRRLLDQLEKRGGQ